MVLSPGQDFVLSGSTDHKLYIWDAETSQSQPLAELDYHIGEVNITLNYHLINKNSRSMESIGAQPIITL